MHPNVPKDQPSQVADLPLASSLPQGSAPVAAGPTGSSGRDGIGSQQRAAEQAKQLVEQYGRDPFKLSSAFGTFKEQYIQEQYQIAPSSIEK